MATTMTDNKAELALAFLQSHPPSAAAILEQLPMQDVAAFLRDVPHTFAAPVLEKMLPQYTARLSRYLEPELAAGFLSRMEVSRATVILRHADESVRQSLLELLPEKTALACKLMLNYAEDQVGAWMAVHMATLPVDCTVKTALERLALDDAFSDSDSIYVVDREGNLHGLLHIVRLLRAGPETPIAALMQKDMDVIAGRTSLTSAANHNGWTSSDTLPVINRNHRLVGILRHVDLRKGSEQVSTRIDAPHGSDPINTIFEIYGGSWLALFNTIGGWMDKEKKQGDYR